MSTPQEQIARDPMLTGTPRPIIVPHLSLNGSGLGTLCEERLKARHSVHASIDALNACYPNARDYATAADYEAAAREWNDRLREMRRIFYALVDEAGSLFKSKRERDASRAS